MLIVLVIILIGSTSPCHCASVLLSCLLYCSNCFVVQAEHRAAEAERAVLKLQKEIDRLEGT